MHTAARKPRKLPKSRIEFADYVTPSHTGQLLLDGHPVDTRQLQDIIQEFHELDFHHVQETKQGLAILDSACDTSAIGDTPGILMSTLANLLMSLAIPNIPLLGKISPLS